jgi:SAM-dependent methyltransferase
MKSNTPNPILRNLHCLLCLKCGENKWQTSTTSLICEVCSNEYPILKNGKVLTVNEHINLPTWEDVSEGFNLLKGNEHPIKIDKLGGPRINQLRAALNIKGLAVNLGSGQDNYPDFINLDLGEYEPVHVVADFTKIPLTTGSIELVACNSVLEHIYEYELVVNEISRIIKKGGYLYLSVPLMSIRHHKYDYHRWTSVGLAKLIASNFTIVESGACRGVAYSLISFVDALITHKIHNKLMLWICRKLWRGLSFPLLLIRDEATEEYQAMANTIYIVGIRK